METRMTVGMNATILLMTYTYIAPPQAPMRGPPRRHRLALFLRVPRHYPVLYPRDGAGVAIGDGRYVQFYAASGQSDALLTMAKFSIRGPVCQLH